LKLTWANEKKIVHGIPRGGTGDTETFCCYFGLRAVDDAHGAPPFFFILPYVSTDITKLP